MVKIVRAQGLDGDSPSLGLLDGEVIVGLEREGGAPVRALTEVLGRTDAELRDLATGARRSLVEVTLVAPYTELFRNMLCVGKNYAEHAKEFTDSGYDQTAVEADDAPLIVFTKPLTSLVGPTDPIVVPTSLAEAIDYEAELAVIIGLAGRDIPLEAAGRHVFGYTVINDVTARDLQQRHRQWFLAKALDRTCPIGPAVVTAEGLDGADLRVRSWVNGEPRQDARTTQMIYDVPALIAAISEKLTLMPGDVIATGTAAGVGIGFTPPRFLRDGDVVRIEIEGVGVLENQLQVVPDRQAAAVPVERGATRTA